MSDHEHATSTQARALVPDRQPGPLRRRDAEAGRRALARRSRRTSTPEAAGPRGLEADAERARTRSPRSAWRPTRRPPASASSPGCTPSRRRRCGSPGSPGCAKPLAHLHTQFNRELPWARDRHGLHEPEPVGPRRPRVRVHRRAPAARPRRSWSATGRTTRSLAELDGWSRVACAVAESRKLKIARFGGMNMREVAVTGGDRVEAQIQLGWSINGYGVGDLVGRIAEVARRRGRPAGRGVRGRRTRWRRRCAGAARSARACATPPGRRSACAASSTSGGFGAFTTTFEDLHGLKQLPGLACQRLMADGYGFGAEGDWKTAGARPR